ncbi:MAG: YtxH domain-containing protein [Anaerolinea sp.]|nr:YtxH domain-containing protein [Anaerolinea sp.]
MNKLLSLLLGFTVGAIIGSLLVLVFSPVSGQKVVNALKAGYAETLDEARQASDQRKRELEAEYKRMRTK